MGVVLVKKHIVSYCLDEQSNAVQFTVKLFNQLNFANKMKCFNFKSGHAMWVMKLIKVY